jgi:hypothetical protein
VTFLIWWSVRSLIWTSQFFLKLSLDVAILLLYWYVNRNEKWRNYEINRDEEECFGITVEGEKNWYKSITVFSILYVYISVDRNRRYILKVKIQRWKIFVVLYITHNGKKDRPVVRRTESCGTYCYTLNEKKKKTGRSYVGLKHAVLNLICQYFETTPAWSFINNAEYVIYI